MLITTLNHLLFYSWTGGLTSNEQPLGLLKPAALNHFGRKSVSFCVSVWELDLYWHIDGLIGQRVLKHSVTDYKGHENTKNENCRALAKVCALWVPSSCCCACVSFYLYKSVVKMKHSINLNLVLQGVNVMLYKVNTEKGHFHEKFSNSSWKVLQLLI